MRVLLLIKILFTSALIYAQISVKSSLSDSVFFKKRISGNVKQLYKWKDKLGDNYLIFTTTDYIKSIAKKSMYGEDCENGCSDKKLYVYHFIGEDSMLWEVKDFIKACNYDNLVEFRDSATKITDLDKNGIAEIWFMYSMICASDVSPRTLKLIMFQVNKKYAIRGTSQPSKNMVDTEYGGKFNPEKAFQTLPENFKAFASKVWKENLYDMK